MEKLRSFNLLFVFTILMISCNAQESNIQSVALTNITLIDVENSKSLNSMTIIIENDKIKSILTSDSKKIDDTIKVIDMSGNYVIPGLIDSHVHLFRPTDRIQILKKLLFSGITSVRDMGGDARVYQNLIEEIQKGNLVGPNIYYSATFFGPEFLKDPRTKFAAQGFEPGEAPWMRLITDETNLKDVMTEAKEAGVTGIKVYSNIMPDLLKKISAAAHEQGLKIWSHASVFPSKPSDAANAGIDVLSHGVGMIFEVEPNMPSSFNEAIRKVVPLQDFKNTDALAPEFIALFKKMKSNAAIFEPTLSSWNNTSRSHQQKNAKPEKANPTAHLSNAAKKLDVHAMNDWVKRITKAAYTNGVTISAGTDFNKTIKWVQDEIKYLTDCGLTNIAAIKAATLNNAKAIGIENTHGSIAIGKQADLVILSKNPLENIENLRAVLAVYKDGRKYSARE